MIRLVSTLPDVETPSAEYLRMKCLFDAYRNDRNVLFWEQGEGNAFLSLADGNMTIYNPSGDVEEMIPFLRMLSPKAVFSDADTLAAIGRIPYQKYTVLCRQADMQGQPQGDFLSSKEIYELFSAGRLHLPEYPPFAVDFCRRLNHGGAAYFGLAGQCAAVTVFAGNFALLTGIVSLKKGLGTAALEGILQKNKGRTVLACSEESVKPFYIKNGFRTLYNAGSWKHEYSSFF